MCVPLNLKTANNLVVDPIRDGQNWYSYCGNNPVNRVDPTGLFVESLWDIGSLLIGGVSLVNNIKEGDLRGVAVDSIGILADVVAVAVPFLPGGASVAIKAKRALEIGDNTVNAIDDVVSVIDAAEEGNVVGIITHSAGIISSVLGVSGVAERATEAAKDADRAARNASTTSSVITWATEEEMQKTVATVVKSIDIASDSTELTVDVIDED